MLAAARAQLMAEIEHGASEAASSPEGRWSLTEIVYHLHLSEKTIGRLIQKVLDSGQRHDRASEEQLRAEWERLMQTVARRERRASAPAPAVPANAPGLSEAVELLHQSRQRLLEITAGTSLDDLASISAPHPLQAIGTLTGASWLSLIGYHDLRHIGQIRELQPTAVQQG
jgi:hypothetical protein